MNILGRYLLTDADLVRIRRENTKLDIEFIRRELVLRGVKSSSPAYRFLGDYEYFILKKLREDAGRWT